MAGSLAAAKRVRSIRRYQPTIVADLAVGTGMLKIIKLESSGDKGSSNLTLNQTLPGHNGRVEVRRAD